MNGLEFEQLENIDVLIPENAIALVAVADFLIQDNAVAENRIDVVGFADTKPIASNTTPLGRSQNRRIEILIDS